jgi:hypothetical protein
VLLRAVVASREREDQRVAALEFTEPATDGSASPAIATDAPVLTRVAVRAQMDRRRWPQQRGAVLRNRGRASRSDADRSDGFDQLRGVEPLREDGVGAGV